MFYRNFHCYNFLSLSDEIYLQKNYILFPPFLVFAFSRNRQVILCEINDFSSFSSRHIFSVYIDTFILFKMIIRDFYFHVCVSNVTETV